MIHRRGNIYVNTNKKLYMIVSFELNKVTLISLATGMKWSRPVKVNNSLSISKREFEKLSSSGSFKLVKNVTATFDVVEPASDAGVKVGKQHD